MVGGAVHFRPDTKSVRGGGGGGGGWGGGWVLSGASGPIQKAERGGSLAEDGAVPYMKGGVATPPPPWIRLWFDVHGQLLPETVRQMKSHPGVTPMTIVPYTQLNFYHWRYAPYFGNNTPVNRSGDIRPGKIIGVSQLL